MTGSAASLAAPRAAPPVWHAAAAGLISMLLGIGLSRFGYPPLIPALIQAGWFTPAQAAYLGAANLAGYLLGALAVRRLAHRFAPPALIRVSLVVCTASFAACALPLGFWWYFPWRTASGVIGGLLMVLAASSVLAYTRPGRRGLVGGVIFTGVGLGITLSGTLVPRLVHFGIPETWLTFAAVSAGLTLFAWKGLPPVSPASHAPARSGPAPESARPAAGILLLVCAYGLYGAGFVPHTVFWVDYIARGLGRGIPMGAGYWVLLGMGAACGPLTLGLLADRIGFGASLRLSLIANAATVGLPLVSDGPFALAASSIGTGALAVGITSLTSGRVIELVPSAHQRQVWGWMTLSFSICYAAAGYGLSFLFSRTGAYLTLFGLGAASLTAAAVLEIASARLSRPLAPSIGMS